jgi:hypothetical protein
MPVGVDGSFEMVISMSDMRTMDTILEERPDIYFSIETGPLKGFRSKTIKDILVLQTSPVTGISNTTIDLQDVTVFRDQGIYFSLEGRLCSLGGTGLSNARIAVVSDDWFRDDLIGVGHTDKTGKFRLSFTRDEFNQEWGMEKDKPRLYIVVSTWSERDQKLLAFETIEFFDLCFELGHEDLGDICLSQWAEGKPLFDPEMDHTPGWSKQVARLNIDEDLVNECLVEITPLVEQLTGWRNLLDGLHVEVTDRMGEWALKDLVPLMGLESGSFAEKCSSLLFDQCFKFAGLYSPTHHTLVVNRPLMERNNLDALKVIIGHELVHVGQFKNYPHLIEEHNARLLEFEELLNSVEDSSLEDVVAKIKTLGMQGQMQELEGYAFYIQKDFLEVHYNMATFFPHSSLFESALKTLLGVLELEAGLQQVQELKSSQYTDGADAYRQAAGIAWGPARFR